MTANLRAGGNRLKLGVFAFNGMGLVRTYAPDRFELSWEASLDIAVQADMLGLEAIVPFARFRSPVDPHHYSGQVFDNFAWSGAIAARTNWSYVMSTVHVTNVHPIFAAKSMATIDHISKGRFALNIVTGWSPEETEMFGVPLLPREDRYAFADEWISAVKQLWTDEDAFDFKGRFIDIKGGQSQPKPVQKPHPVLMNAGASDVGKDFAAKHCEIAFVNPSTDFAKMTADIADYRSVARERYGRDIQVWGTCSIVQGETMADAAALADRYVAHADKPYIDSYFARLGRELSSEEHAALERKWAAGGNGQTIIGDAPFIAEALTRMSECGIDGLLLTWVDYAQGVRDFGKSVLPLLESGGLRQPHVHP